MSVSSYWRDHGWFRSAVYVAAIVFLMLGVVIGVNYHYQRKILGSQMELRCQEMAESVVGGVTHSLSVGDNDVVRKQFEELEDNLPSTDVYIYDYKGEISFATKSESVDGSFHELLGDERLVKLSEEMLETGEKTPAFDKRVNGKLHKGVIVPSLNRKQCHHCHGESQKVLGGIAVMVDTSQARAAVETSRNIGVAAGGICLVAVVLAIYFVFSRLASNIMGSVDRIKKTSDAAAESSDKLMETSAMMKEKAVQGSEMSKTTSSAAQEVADRIASIASSADEVSGQITEVNSSSNDVSTEIESVNSNLSDVSSNLMTVAAAAEEMSTAVGSVSAAMEQMHTSYSEVSKSTQDCAAMTSRASSDASRTSEIVNKLGQSAGEIGSVVELINTIASQTNLLALNAAIEAAGAGEAGKGFAVVANEVKELAKQTSGATENIRRKVEDMQENTNSAISAIEGITGVMTDIDTAISSIASSVEEQTATADEMSRNVSESAESADSVAKNVNEAAIWTDEVAKSMDKMASVEADVSTSLQEVTNTVKLIAEDVAKASTGTEEVAENITSLAELVEEAMNASDSQHKRAEKMARMAAELKSHMEKFTI